MDFEELPTGVVVIAAIVGWYMFAAAVMRLLIWFVGRPTSAEQWETFHFFYALSPILFPVMAVVYICWFTAWVITLGIIPAPWSSPSAQ